MVKTSPSSAGDIGSNPGPVAKLPHASQPKNQNIKQKKYCNKLNTRILKIKELKYLYTGVDLFDY